VQREDWGPVLDVLAAGEFGGFYSNRRVGDLLDLGYRGMGEYETLLRVRMEAMRLWERQVRRRRAI
jgi:hypothetical protein